MSHPFFVAPYKPSEWETIITDLYLDPSIYGEKMRLEWSDVVFYDPHAGTSLAWGLLGQNKVRIHGALQDNNQVVWLDFPIIRFFLWHRSVIPDKYDLFIFRDSSWDSLKLTKESTYDDIRRFTD